MPCLDVYLLMMEGADPDLMGALLILADRDRDLTPGDRLVLQELAHPPAPLDDDSTGI